MAEARSISLLAATLLSAALPAQTLRDITPLEVAVNAAYAREFGETIVHPATFFETPGGRCKDLHLTTTAYFRTSPASAQLLSLYLTHDGRTVLRRSQSSKVIIPAGTFRVLVVIVRYPMTSGSSDLERWEAAQAKIKQDHASFASNHGYREPIVSFENTNALIDVSEIADPRDLASVREAAARKGINTESHQFIVSINMNPNRPEGGFAGADGFVYMGNYGRWSRPLTASEWVNVANAVYHHEVAHHWGWPGSHDWSRECNGQRTTAPFIVAPVLFGWIDLDGDKVPEILDATPYGRPMP